MRFGLGPLSLAHFDGRALIRMAEAAEAAGFDALWLAEDRAAGAGGGLAAAAFVAQHTVLSVGVAVAFDLYHPLHLAEDSAVADLASGGRVELLLTPSPPAAAVRYGVAAVGGRREEELSVLAQALAGSHVRFKGRHLSVPAELPENQPSPTGLAVNPRPAQARIPGWLAVTEASQRELARSLGFGGAVRLEEREYFVQAPPAALPDIALCPGHVSVAELQAVAGQGAGYFLIGASTDEQARAASPIFARMRMADLPDWVLAQAEAAG
ncbi:MAG: LLM class flavin-dependent oxidoreductase [Chloroflexota bacterium]